MIGGVLIAQPRESLQEETHSVPSLEAAHETDHKPAVGLQSASERSIVHFWAKARGIDRVRQNFNFSALYSGVLEVTTQCLGNRDQQIRSVPAATLDPSGEGTKDRPSAVFLFLVSEGGINFQY